MRRATGAVTSAPVLMAKKPRKPRADKKPLDKKMVARVGVKLTPAGRRALSAQAKLAGYASTSEYLRTLANVGRRALIDGGNPIAAFDFNEGVPE